MSQSTINRVIETLEFNKYSSQSSLFFTSKQYDLDELLFEERLVVDVAKKLNATSVNVRTI
jgi:hypothetical protein